MSRLGDGDLRSDLVDHAEDGVQLGSPGPQARGDESEASGVIVGAERDDRDDCDHALGLRQAGNHELGADS